MTRWHKADCATPIVVVDTTTQTPHCRGCNAVVEIDHIIADHVAHHAPVEIPPDEPVGQMALWWPPSVPYTLSHGKVPGKDVSKQASHVTTLAQPRQSTSPPEASLSAYETTLSGEEFRLARFDAPPDGAGPDHPIHITLEVFRRDDCPEYETVSYTWGGEEDDSTPCRPVFVGPHWDVLLQTANCWHMLRYLRPRRGIRHVWIDAICINQDDPAERGLQVASMRSVYEQCSRVVIYLGADLVAPPTSEIEARMYPPRHGLHEFDRVMGPSLGRRETAMTLPDLLTRRYFTRVWVIQELILSRAAVMPVAGREFWANALTPIKYEETRKLKNPSSPDGWNWESTTVPWMRDFCRGSLHASTTFYDVLRRTWQSKATDPRDKFFGILGLVDAKRPSPAVMAPYEQVNGSASTSITPDYNISIRHVLTGILAHTLLNHGITEVLFNASGLAAPLNHSSWLPDMNNISEGQRGDRDDFRRTQRRHVKATQVLPSTREYYEKQSVVTLTYLSQPLSRRDFPVRRLWSHPYNHVCIHVDTPGLDDLLNDPRHRKTKLGGSWNQRQISLPSLYHLHSWRGGATVDSSTGDLLLKACHLLQFNSSPQKADHLPGNSMDAGAAMIPYVIQEGLCSLFVAVPEIDPYLEESVPAGKNHLFYLEKEDTRDATPEFLLLFMREVEGTDMGSCHEVRRPREFKLILCCPYLDMFFMFRNPNPSNSSEVPNPSIHQVNVRHSLYATLFCVLREIRERWREFDSQGDLKESEIHQPGKPGRIEPPATPESYIDWQRMFPGRFWPVLPIDRVLPLCQAILSSERSGAQDAETAFASKYVACLNSELPLHNARLVNETDADNVRAAWVEISIHPDGVDFLFWRSSTNPFYLQRAGTPGINWECRYFSTSGAAQTAVPEKSDSDDELEMGNYGFWQPFIRPPRPRWPTHWRFDPLKTVEVRARVSDLCEFIKTTQMFKQMQRLHYMFRPPEGSNERPPLKAKTWAGEEDETDMILRGPKDGDHFLPERPYRPWPEEVVRDFKADGVYWNIRIS